MSESLHIGHITAMALAHPVHLIGMGYCVLFQITWNKGSITSDGLWDSMERKIVVQKDGEIFEISNQDAILKLVKSAIQACPPDLGIEDDFLIDHWIACTNKGVPTTPQLIMELLHLEQLLSRGEQRIFHARKRRQMGDNYEELVADFKAHTKSLEEIMGRLSRRTGKHAPKLSLQKFRDNLDGYQHLLSLLNP